MFYILNNINNEEQLWKFSFQYYSYLLLEDNIILLNKNKNKIIKIFINSILIKEKN